MSESSIHRFIIPPVPPLKLSNGLDDPLKRHRAVLVALDSEIGGTINRDGESAFSMLLNKDVGGQPDIEIAGDAVTGVGTFSLVSAF
jgi:hypothetical protein